MPERSFPEDSLFYLFCPVFSEIWGYSRKHKHKKHKQQKEITAQLLPRLTAASPIRSAGHRGAAGREFGGAAAAAPPLCSSYTKGGNRMTLNSNRAVRSIFSDRASIGGLGESFELRVSILKCFVSLISGPTLVPRRGNSTLGALELLSRLPASLHAAHFRLAEIKS